MGAKASCPENADNISREEHVLKAKKAEKMSGDAQSAGIGLAATAGAAAAGAVPAGIAGAVIMIQAAGASLTIPIAGPVVAAVLAGLAGLSAIAGGISIGVSKYQQAKAEEERLAAEQQLKDMAIEWHVDRVIGSGAYGQVLLCTKGENEHVAVKILKKGSCTSEEHLRLFEQEFSAMCRLDHACVLRALSFIPGCSESGPMIVTEYMANGSIARIMDGCEISHGQTSIIAAGIAFGMEYIHSKGVIHQDLKPENVLVDENGYPHTCDFGLAKLVRNGTQSIVGGTNGYMAPEMYRKLFVDRKVSCTGKVDVFAFGVILYEIIFGKRVFSGSISIISEHCREGVRPKIDERDLTKRSVKPEVVSLIRACWDVNPDDRPPFGEIIETLKSLDFMLFTEGDRSELDRFIEMIDRTNERRMA